MLDPAETLQAPTPAELEAERYERLAKIVAACVGLGIVALAAGASKLAVWW